MKGKVITNITPQQKIVAVNNKFGNTNIKNQQGTTRVLFDSLPIAGQTSYRFFETASSRQYPLTNIGAEGNRLNVGETFVVQKIYFGLIVLDPDTGDYLSFQPLPMLAPNSFFKGEFSFQIANSIVLKQLPIEMFQDNTLNPTSNNNLDVAFGTFTDIVIPPLLEYVLTVRTAQAGIDPTNSIRLACFIEGTAGILAPQTTF
jgi:hypothetical protein